MYTICWNLAGTPALLKLSFQNSKSIVFGKLESGGNAGSIETTTECPLWVLFTGWNLAGTPALLKLPPTRYPSSSTFMLESGGNAGSIETTL